MSKPAPLITLGSVLLLALIFLLANTQVGTPASTDAGAAATTPSAGAWTTPSASAGTTPSAAAGTSQAATSAPSRALYTGRTSGDQVTVAIAINGGKAAADLNPGEASEVSLQGSVDGGRVTLSNPNGAGISASVSGQAMFGTVTGFLGQSFPFSAEQTAVQAVYTGRSSGNQVTLAVVTQGGKATGYVCNGKNIEAWLQGSVNGNQVSLAGNNGTSLSASLSGLAMFGTVTAAAGQSFPFAAALSPHPAGIFQARIAVNGLATRIGWAVLPDGTQVGLAVAANAKTPAPSLNLSDGSFTLDGTSYKAAPVAGNETVVLP